MVKQSIQKCTGLLSDFRCVNHRVALISDLLEKNDLRNSAGFCERNNGVRFKSCQKIHFYPLYVTDFSIL